MHVALGEVAAAGVQRQVAVRGQETLLDEVLVAAVRRAEAVLDEAHQHPAGEVLVALQHIDVAGAHPGHLVEARGEGLEGRSGVVWRVVHRRTGAEVGADGGAEQVGGRMGDVLGAFGGHQHHGGGAVVFQAAVVEVKGFDDPAGGVVGGLVEGPSVHHRPWVVLRVVVGGQGDGPQCLLAHPMVVHEALHLHGEHLRRRHQPIGCRLGAFADNRLAPGALAEAAKLALGQRPEHHHAFGQPAGDGGCGVADSGGPAATTAAPLHVGEPKLPAAQGGGKARGVAAVVAVGGEAVHLPRRDARVFAGRDDGLEGQLELGVRGLAALEVAGLADPGHRD